MFYINKVAFQKWFEKEKLIETKKKVKMNLFYQLLIM